MTGPSNHRSQLGAKCPGTRPGRVGPQPYTFDRGHSATSVARASISSPSRTAMRVMAATCFVALLAIGEPAWPAHRCLAPSPGAAVLLPALLGLRLPPCSSL